MKAIRIFKENIRGLLAKRGITPHAFAAAFGRDDSWASKLLNDSPPGIGEKERGTRLSALDEIADFFGLDVQHLFQPGLVEGSERRSGTDRRIRTDRRVNARRPDLPKTPIRQVSVTPEDEQILDDLHALKYEDYQRVKGWINVARLGAGSGRRTPPRGEPTTEVPPPRRRGPQARGAKKPKGQDRNEK